MLQNEGEELIKRCKKHILNVMQSLHDCRANGKGMHNKQIEEAAGFDLQLPRQDDWFTWSLLMRMPIDRRRIQDLLIIFPNAAFTWSLLMRMAIDDQIEFITREKKGTKHFRLKS